jgi:hypothetical protein
MRVVGDTSGGGAPGGFPTGPRSTVSGTTRAGPQCERTSGTVAPIVIVMDVAEPPLAIPATVPHSAGGAAHRAPRDGDLLARIGKRGWVHRLADRRTSCVGERGRAVTGSDHDRDIAVGGKLGHLGERRRFVRAAVGGGVPREPDPGKEPLHAGHTADTQSDADESVAERSCLRALDGGVGPDLGRRSGPGDLGSLPRGGRRHQEGTPVELHRCEELTGGTDVRAGGRRCRCARGGPRIRAGDKRSHHEHGHNPEHEGGAHPHHVTMHRSL